MKLEIEISEVVADLLAVIDDAGDIKAVVEQLIYHAQQGVYRPGAWEREWLTQAFGDEFIARLEPGDPWGRPGMTHIFQRPRTAPSGLN